MRVMGTNTWEFDAPTNLLVQRAMEFTEKVEANGIARLHEACIAGDARVLWCSWNTDDLAALQAAFDELNRESGLKSTLTPVDVFYP